MTAATKALHILVVGGGGREHALADKIVQSPLCRVLSIAPGNAGTPGTRVNIAADDVGSLVDYSVSSNVDLVIIGPDAAIAAGLADALHAKGIKAFGPTMAAGRLESSKTYTREIAAELGIPSPAFAQFAAGDAAGAQAWADAFGQPVVVKQDGLAAGKGVIVPSSATELADAINAISITGPFIVEERLIGPECSLIAFCDGVTAVALPLVQDHKRLNDGDLGPNTGGMGAYAPAPVNVATADLMAAFIQPVVDHLATNGTPYVGVLFAGIMLCADGPKLLEYNCRFGDPETQVLMPLLKSDLVELALACVDGTLTATPVRCSAQSALTVVVCAPGYPGEPVRGSSISGLDSAALTATVFHAGTALDAGGSLISNGGRVLSVTGVGDTLADARANAYRAAEHIQFDGAHHRRDIGWRASGASITSYAAAGVNIDEGNRAVSAMKEAVEATHGPEVLRGVGSFGGVFDLASIKDMNHPVLVASTDGVGTKVELSARANRHWVSGHDIVNHCINDVLVQGARPLFFLDYFASGVIDATQVASIVTGMAEACAASGCALLGGETAEMPGVYRPGAFDVAGTLVGVAERADLLPRNVAVGDVLIGVASNGPHTNGYSLLRKVFEWLPFDAQPAPLDMPIIDALLQPHRSYLNVLMPALGTGKVNALAHITGGGLVENVPRALPDAVDAIIYLGSFPILPLFQLVQELTTGMDLVELYRTVNMGIGMVVIVRPDDVAAVQASIPETTWVIGELVPGRKVVQLR